MENLLKELQIGSSVDNFLVAHGLDFNISKRPLFDENNNPSGYYGLYNDSLNKCINTVKDGYVVSQNREILELVVAGTERFGDDLSVKFAGSINEGRKVYIQLAIKGNAIVGNDEIERYITIIDSNDGSTSLGIGIGDLTMSCKNQFFKFYKNSEFVMRHSSSLEEKLRQIPFIVESALSRSIKQIELYREFVSTDISRDLAHKMVKHVLGYDREFTSVKDLSEKSVRAINKMDMLYEMINLEMNSKGDNVWGLHSGVTRFTTHENSAPKRTNGRVESLMLGGGYTMNQKSLEFSKQLVY